jgi:ABC-type bacteriocin/lantibiotic exporter with double-glycine peptidase domain
MMWELVIISVAAIAAIVLMFKWSIQERSKMLNRLMSRNYQEYEYYDKIVPEEVDEIKKLREEARGIRKTEDEEAKIQDARYQAEIDQLKQFEEEWNPEEVDLEKLKENIRKEE